MIKFTHATPDHSYLVGRCLVEDQGITHDVFKDQGEEEPAEEVEAAEGEEVVEKVEEDILTAFKHVYVKEVVREQRMHY